MSGGNTDDHDAMVAERTAASAAIVNSDAAARLIVAGPGTGKTYTFRQALEAAEGRGLALTFIRNLVADLAEALGDVADVFTFHGFCKHQMHRNAIDGLSNPIDYYPALLELLAEDLRLLGGSGDSRRLSRALYELDDSAGLISRTIGTGNYYTAVGHTDVVYRVLKCFEDDEESIPGYALVVVDEYQDFNRLETQFIALMATGSPILIAGDDDQALYSFKRASADFIRDLADPSSGYERFELPYCSRCTSVVVAAVNAVIDRACGSGSLEGRLEKNYICYLPDKQERSEQYARIIDARCSVQTSRAPYMGRYVTEQIAQIPVAEIAESHAGGYPTVLIIGPNPFLSQVHAEVSAGFPHARMSTSTPTGVDPLDGYRRLLEDDRSRLGWRILIAAFPSDAGDAAIVRAHSDDLDLVDLLPSTWVQGHLVVVALLGRIKKGEALSEDEAELVCGHTGRSMDELAVLLDAPSDEDAPPPEDGDDDPSQPTIVCTSLVGAKGMSAAHVFVVGMNSEHFPRDPRAITDDEVCQFLVALSRTRSCCHLVSTGRLGVATLRPSPFLGWVSSHTERRRIDKDYFFS